MITKDLIDRINALSRKERQCGLTGEERLEQAVLRRKYLDSVRDQLREQLESAGIPKKHGRDCACGCHGARGN